MNPSVKLYVVKMPPKLQTNVFLQLLECVDDSRRKRILNCKNIMLAQSSLMGDILVRYLALDLVHLTSVDFRYHHFENGKPYASGCDSFHFNISHSGQYIAVSAGPFETGCDIQEYQKNYQGMEQMVFSKSEQQLIQSDKDFFQLWTLKESFLKAIGKGFMVDPTLYTVADKKGTTRILYQNNEYQFYSFENFDNYAVSVCACGKIEEEIGLIPIEKIIHIVLADRQI